MRLFSERKGLITVPRIIQTNGMSDELRNRLWNILDFYLWSSGGYHLSPTTIQDFQDVYQIIAFSKGLWHSYFKKPVDIIPNIPSEILERIREYYFKTPWNEVYDFIAFVDGYYADYNVGPGMRSALNDVLSEELAGYSLIDGQIVDITDKQEITMLQDALQDTKFSIVTSHLKQALKLLSDRESPDFRNSIKESISAVEAMARILTGDDKATLGDALKMLKNAHGLHPALSDGFYKIYGYTSDADGIRHSMMEEPNLGPDDAKFFLLSCTSFTNYLKAKTAK